MLVKEYRILLPLTVEEYRIAQLYMIMKKSRDESEGSGSGVEIIRNEPYCNGPGGSGQYTYKIYHIGNHLPGWIRGILPLSALRIVEEAWNAYPYTKTRYTCQFIDKFSIEVETRYYDDAGTRPNVFGLDDSILSSRVIDFMDIVKDPVSPFDYRKDEDPKLYISKMTKRGPLGDNWINENISSSAPVMCAYKLCKVDFPYWGMQSKVEKFIHDIALRKTMLRAHRQAWAWQDEWFGLTIADIRRLERKTQETLMRVMGDKGSEESENMDDALAAADSGNKHLHIMSDSYMKQSRSQHSLASIHLRSIEQSSASTGSSDDNDEYYDAFDFVNTPGNDLRSDVLLSTRPTVNISEVSEASNVTVTINAPSCPVRHLLLVFHGGSALDTSSDQQNIPNKLSDLNILRSTFADVIKAHYLSIGNEIAFRLVPCRAVCSNVMNALLRLCPYGCEKSASSDALMKYENFSPVVVPLLSTMTARYQDRLVEIMDKANHVYTEFLESVEGTGFSGEVIIIADSIGGIVAFDLLCAAARAPESSRSSVSRAELNTSDVTLAQSLILQSALDVEGSLSKALSSLNGGVRPELSNQSGSTTNRQSSSERPHLNFTVQRIFLLGCPLGLVLASRRLQFPTGALHAPNVSQVYNLYYAVDSYSFRLEPLLVTNFSSIPPQLVPRYDRFPLGDDRSTHILDCVQKYVVELQPTAEDDVQLTQKRSLSVDATEVLRNALTKGRDVSQDVAGDVLARWWGTRRIDYSLYCPEGISSFPVVALPSILHSSFWESKDVAAFIIRQLSTEETFAFKPETPALFESLKPTERWRRRHTSFKIRNISPNHRANDVILNENAPQCISARFMYGFLDVVALSGESVDIYVINDEERGDWLYCGTETTDSHGRLHYQIPESKRLPLGLHSLRMMVCGDHSYVDVFVAIVPPHTDCIVFSIDGSFSASLSVSGKNPKVRPGAVDVVRYWQDLGYIILYVTARPDIQQRLVVSWLSQHNFPHGLLFFTEGISADPLRQKTNYLKSLLSEHQVCIRAAYGSGKDVHVYKEVGLNKETIFAIGRVSKKWQSDCQMLSKGYSAHLADLTSGVYLKLARAAQGNGRMFVRRKCFGASLTVSKYSGGMIVQRSQSFTPRSGRYRVGEFDSNRFSRLPSPRKSVSPFSSHSDGKRFDPTR